MEKIINLPDRPGTSSRAAAASRLGGEMCRDSHREVRYAFCTKINNTAGKTNAAHHRPRHGRLPTPRRRRRCRAHSFGLTQVCQLRRSAVVQNVPRGKIPVHDGWAGGGAERASWAVVRRVYAWRHRRSQGGGGGCDKMFAFLMNTVNLVYYELALLQLSENCCAPHSS